MVTAGSLGADTGRRKMKTKPKDKMKAGKIEHVAEMKPKKGMPPAFMKKKGAKRGR
jgi:hypothetical protein